MKIDLELYSVNKWVVLRWFNSQGDRDISRTIGMMSAVTFVPCIVVAYWLGEETKWQDPEAERSIKMLIDFYGYTEILNKPPGAPI